MQKKLWEATISQKENSNLRSFEKFLNNKYNFKSNKNYKKLKQIGSWDDIEDSYEVKSDLRSKDAISLASFSDFTT